MAEKGLSAGWKIFSPCPKCGAGVPNIVWIPPFAGCSNYNRTPNEHTNLEHFHASCWRCTHGWPADMNGLIL